MAKRGLGQRILSLVTVFSLITGMLQVSAAAAESITYELGGKVYTGDLGNRFWKLGEEQLELTLDEILANYSGLTRAQVAQIIMNFVMKG